MRRDARDEFPEQERYELDERPAYRFQANRREFVQVLGSGLIIAAAATSAPGQQRSGRGRGPSSRREELVADRIHIGADGNVTVLTSKVEVGQGSRTQIAQAAAEELRLPVERVQVIMADTERCPDDGGTAGSRTTPSTIPRVQNAVSFARQVLTELAAAQLQVDASTIKVHDGNFSDPGSGAQISLAELAALDGLDGALRRPVPEGIAITRVSQWEVLGTSVPKVTGRDVVTGVASYPSDIQRPDMLYGAILRPPSFNAQLTGIDLTPARSMAEVTVVHDGNFVGCAAKNSWLAAKAVEALRETAQWDEGEHVSSERLFDHLKATARGDGRGRTRGDEARSDSAKQTFSSTFTIAYIQHAPMEPRAAMAEWAAGALTVWTGTQQPSRVRGELADAFRISEDRVRVIVPDTGGGFGGKHTGEAAVEAARLAKAAGRPVSLRWTRQEECTWAYCRPAGVIDVEARLDDAGRIVSWNFINYNSGSSAIETPYRVGGGRTSSVGSDSPLRQGSYRALASTANTFARESVMDELAAAADRDPLEFRLAHLDEGRLRDVLQDAANHFQWGARRRQRRAGHGFGLACGTEKGSYVAACAEVQVTDGKLQIVSICQAFECGAIQNPGNLRAQVEGCIVMGLGGALYEEVLFSGGKVTNASFSQYRVPRMEDVPEMQIVLRDRPDLPSVGAGETPIIAVAPAIANAICDATGKRLRSMPLRTAELG